MIPALSDYYRLATNSLSSTSTEYSSGHEGFFRFGANISCYGRCRSGVAVDVKNSVNFDASKEILLRGSIIDLPFSSSEVIENLRRERYQKDLRRGNSFVTKELIRKSYYLVREVLPISVRRHLQKIYFSGWQKFDFPAWPVDFTVDDLHEALLRLSMEASGAQKVPFIWFWPEGAPSCLIMTHDVETMAGRDFAPQVMDLDKSYELKASFQVIPEKRYEVPDDFVREIRDRGFEFNIHDLNHDGNLYRRREEFVLRAKRINEYVHQYEARGFRAGAMYRNLDWYDAYEFSYDMSVPNVAHLEPKRGGCCTVMPYFVGKIVELPLTTTQDYSLFYILNDYSIDLWKKQLDLIRQHNGLMSFIAHPDYLTDQRSRKVYETLLGYLQGMVAREKIWATLPRDVDGWWRARSQMSLAPCGNGWKITGPQSERARLAYATLDGDQVRYEIVSQTDGALAV